MCKVNGLEEDMRKLNGSEASMRKVNGLIGFAVMMSILCSIIFLTPSIASAETVSAQVWTIGISINGIRMPGNSKAVFYHNDIFIPVKFLSSSMNIGYAYNSADGMISLKSNSPAVDTTSPSLDSLKTGGGIAVKTWTVAINIDGKRAVGNTKAVFYGGDIFVPARYLSLNIGLNYAYSDKDGMIRLTSAAPAPTTAPID